MFQLFTGVERLHPMGKRKCHCCGRDAFAYLIEADGSRTYFCLDHFPAHDAPRHDEQQKPADLGKADDPRS
jgi:hypothetical protein